MKKTAGSVKRQYTRKKTTKKNAAPRKRRSKKSSDFLRAFQLVAMIGAISIFISLAVILIHSNFNKQIDTDVAEENLPDFDTQLQNDILVSNPSKQDEDMQIQSMPPAAENNARPVANNTAQTTTAPAASQTNSGSSTAQSTNATSTVARPTTAAQPVSSANPPAAAGASSAQNINASMQRPAESIGTLVFVIDDAGNNLRELEPFLNISYQLTIAVLPGLPYSAEAARRIRAAGKEVILHQPMEALGGQNPGPCAIYSGMSAAEIRSVLKRNIDEIGPVVGMNNHQGSKVTMDSEAMEVILGFCKENGLYFLDSRTTAETVVPDTARRMGFKISQKDFFIDNEQDRVSMNNYIKSGLERARKNGSAVMIGHTWSPELAPLLAEQLAVFSGQGYSIKTVSDTIE